MPTRQQRADALIKRAEVLEETLARQLRSLDPDLLERFAATVLELGVIDNAQLERIFELASARTLTGAYVAFAHDSSETEGLPLALGRVAQQADGAVASLIVDLSAKAQVALRASVEQALREGWSVQRLSREVKKEIGLTAKQSQWVRNYERDLRLDPAKTRQRELRDRRFDPSVRAGRPLTEEKIQRMTERYRDRWIGHRSRLIAKQELLQASHSVNEATWVEADLRGEVPGFIRKFWWHSHDGDVRNSHLAIPGMNPRGVGIQEAFVTPLGRLRYPCDPMGVAEDRIGCRCAVLFETSNPDRAI